MTDEHADYEELARERRGSEEYRQGYAEARRAFLIGQAVRRRRRAHHPAAGTDQHGPRCRPHRGDSPPRCLNPLDHLAFIAETTEGRLLGMLTTCYQAAPFRSPRRA